MQLFFMTAFEDVRTNWITKFISIYPLKLIAQDLGMEYKLIEYKDLDQVVAALAKGELDVFTPNLMYRKPIISAIIYREGRTRANDKREGWLTGATIWRVSFKHGR